MRHYKRIVSTLLAAGMGLSLLTGCQSGQPTGGTAAAEKTETGGKAEAASEDGAQDKKSELVVGMIASAFGTQSYNDDVLAGMELADQCAQAVCRVGYLRNLQRNSLHAQLLLSQFHSADTRQARIVVNLIRILHLPSAHIGSFHDNHRQPGSLSVYSRTQTRRAAPYHNHIIHLIHLYTPF